MPAKTSKTVPPTITGQRVYLRPLARSDATVMIKLTNESARRFPGVMRRLNGKAQFEKLRKRFESDDSYCFMICRREDDEIVGSISVFEIIRLSRQNGVVGYMIGVPFLRQGYATEALQLILRFAFLKLKLHRIEANIQSHNQASLATAKRAGFTCEGNSRGFLKISGKWRDHERWAILADEWSGRRRQ